jgi:hypothetical protein
MGQDEKLRLQTWRDMVERKGSGLGYEAHLTPME